MSEVPSTSASTPSSDFQYLIGFPLPRSSHSRDRDVSSSLKLPLLAQCLITPRLLVTLFTNPFTFPVCHRSLLPHCIQQYLRSRPGARIAAWGSECYTRTPERHTKRPGTQVGAGLRCRRVGVKRGVCGELALSLEVNLDRGCCHCGK